MNKKMGWSHRRAPIIALLSFAAVLLTALPAQLGAHSGGQDAAARKLVQLSAEALGGTQRLQAVRNITLTGYGQFPWIFGAEEISASSHVPVKLAASNDLRRVYDLEHDRLQERGRAFLLFPFLAARAYSFPLEDDRLDGDIAYNAASANMFGAPPGGDKPRRIADSVGGIDPDGVHVRRMWMMNDPVVLVRAMLDTATGLSKPHPEGKYVVVDITLKRGDRLSAGFFSRTEYCQALCENLPAFVRWSAPQINLGEATFTTWFTGYADIDGLMLPLAYDTRTDWRDIDYYKIYVDHYDINSAIPDLAAPEEVRNAPAPPEFPVRPVVAEKIADHLWRLSPAGTTVIEFKDHLTLFELDANTAQAKATIEFARTLVPGKPVTQLICSHEHFDHVAGLRQAVAEGLAIISRRPNGEQFQEMVSHPAPDYPDDLARSHKTLKFIPVDERLTLSDDTMTLWILWTRNNIHMADGVVAYAPEQKVIMEGDVATASYIWQFWPDNFRDVIDHYHLDVRLDSPVHSVVAEHPGVLTLEQVDELLKGGTERARQLCADDLAKGYYLTGCPVWSKRY